MAKHFESVRQFMQFNIVGIANTLVDFLAFTLLTEALGLRYIPAKILSYTCGIINSYIFNSAWTFKKERRRNPKEFALFVAVNLVSLGVSIGVMYACRNFLRIESDFYCNIIAIPASVAVNFIGNKLFVFQDGR